MKKLNLCILLASLATSLAAQPIPDNTLVEANQDFQYAFAAELDNTNGAEMDYFQSDTQLRVSQPIDAYQVVHFGLGYRYRSYGWEDIAMSPFDELETLDLDLRYRRVFNRQWEASFLGSVSFGKASGGRLTEGGFGDGTRFMGGLFTTWHRNPTLSLTAGVLYMQRLEEDDLFVPIVGLSWRPNDRFHLYTFDGLYLEYDLDEQGKQTLKGSISYEGGSYHAESFAHSNGTVFNDLALEKEAWKLEVGYTYQFSANISLTPYLGMLFAQEYEYNQGDISLAKIEPDTQLIGGLNLEARF